MNKINDESSTLLLSDIPVVMSSLPRSQKIQDLAGSIGFDWTDIHQVIEKLKEEILELEHEIEHGNQSTLEDELGDVLFTTVNIARHLHLDAETALSRANQKFINRFNKVESLVKEKNKKIADLNFDQLLEIWEFVKKIRDR